MKKLISEIMPTLVIASIIALVGLFGSVYSHEVRLAKVEELQMANLKSAISIDKNQDRLMFKLCLLINEGDISSCSRDMP